ncbi:MAG: MSHA biogenesis protein MshJ [Shewanella sp.]
MKQQWNKWASLFDALTQRERVIVALASLVVVGMLCYLPLESLLLEHQSLARQHKATSNDNKVSLQQIDLYQQRLAQNPNDEYNNRLKVLKQQDTNLDEQLSFQMVDMVPANHMPALLNELLGEVTGITLHQFKSIAPTPLLTVGDKKMNLYSHGIRLNLEGDYFSILKFIEAVEAMPSKLYWKKIDYKVDEYPMANVVLELYTLSINKDFISVATQG